VSVLQSLYISPRVPRPTAATTDGSAPPAGIGWMPPRKAFYFLHRGEMLGEIEATAIWGETN
jgi:hypothetical protein